MGWLSQKGGKSILPFLLYQICKIPAKTTRLKIFLTTNRFHWTFITSRFLV